MSLRFLHTLLLLMLLFFSGKSYGQSEKDSIYTLYYFNKFIEYEYVDTLRAQVYVDSAVFYAKRTKNYSFLGDAYRMLGWYYHDRSKYKLAADQYYKSLSYSKKAGDDQGVADAYGNLGNAYLDLDDLQKSLDFQLASLRENEKIIERNRGKEVLARAQDGRATALHNIGAIYSDIEMYDKAFEYAFAGLAHEKEVNNIVGKAISYNTIATLHKQTEHLDSAEYYYKKALEIYNEHSHPYGYASTLLSYATMENSELSESQKKQMIHESLRIRKEMSDVDGEARTLMEICEFYFDDLSTDSLSKMLEHSYHIIELENLESLRQQYFKIYSKYNSRIGKYESAYFALENYLELKAIADEKRHTQDLIAGSIKYQLQTEYYNDSLQQENIFAMERAHHHEQISEIQNIVYLSVIGFIMLIATLIFFITRNRRRKRMNDLLTEKNALIRDQKNIVEQKNQSISDSINYARRLQAAILPTPDQINEFLPDSFLFFKPKDVVSGDFYWFEYKDDTCFLAVADCTGHGVPGAMVSVVCSNALNRAVNEFGLREPRNILDKTREIVIDTFAKSGDNVADGMDISLIAIDRQNKKVRFSGAHNALWIIRDKKYVDPTLYTSVRVQEGEETSLLEFKGDKQPVGLFEEMKPFFQVEIDIQQSDILYLFSDGFADQFGGPEGKKFKYVPFKRVLLNNSKQDLEFQKQQLAKTFQEWIGNNDQVDDVCVIGVRVS